MKYLADILTFVRFVLSIFLLVFAFIGIDFLAGFLIFIFAELTDAFDGTCASKWPFPKNKIPEYRKYAPKYDMLTDALLLSSMMLFFILQVNLVIGLIIGIFLLIFACIVELGVYGKFFGHPDDATKNSLIQKNFPLAKKIILFRRNIYLFSIIFIAFWTLLASNSPLALKIVFLVFSVFVGSFLWFFLSQRRHHISRDVVQLEQKLSKKK